jgi:peptide chain release factor subunit 1
MISREQIEQLATLQPGPDRVLSVYLDLDPARQVRRSHRVALDDLVREAHAGLDDAARAGLEREAAAVRAWLEREPPGGLGAAVFSCQPRGLWQAHFLAVRVRDALAFEPRPDAAPLLSLLDEHERYAVALVDKERARLFTVFLGEMEEVEAFRDPVPGRHDQGGWSQAQHQRHRELHARWHLKRVARDLGEILRRRPFDRLILVGPDQATSELRRLLPRPLAGRVVAAVPAPPGGGDPDVLAATREAQVRVEREHEEQLLGELVDHAGPGGRATLGVAPTLDALWAGLVQVLAVADDLELAGSECPNCGRLQTAPGEAGPGPGGPCPACGQPLRPVRDLVHRLMGRALEQAGRVEVMHDEAARRLRAAGAGLGALLRFPAPPAVTGQEAPS